MGTELKVYLAGKLGSESEREMLESVERLCKSKGFITSFPIEMLGWQTIFPT
ncbi:MAG: hypothetical protein WCK90_00970 [archaeon]